MRIVHVGPVATNALAGALGVADTRGFPEGTTFSPIVPLAVDQHRLGYSVSIVTCDASVDEVTFKRLGGIDIAYCPLRAEPRYRARVRALDFFKREINFLTDAIRSFDPSIVHGHWTYEYGAAATRAGVPSVITMHDLGWEYLWQFRDAYRFMRLLLKYKTMSKVERLTVVAPFMLKKGPLYGYFGQTDLVPNGVSVPDIQISKSSSIDRYESPVFVSVGNQGRIKNIKMAVLALRHIRQVKSSAELHLFGPGLDASFASGEPGVVAHGQVSNSELLDFLERKATVLLHPSKLETFGVIAVEAKIRGVPIVAGEKSGGIPYACGGERGGAVLVDIDNPSAIADGALGLISDLDEYHQHRSSARLDAVSRFSIGRVSRMYLGIYEDVLLSDDGASDVFPNHP